MSRLETTQASSSPASSSDLSATSAPAWAVLRTAADAFLSVSDGGVSDAMRLLADGADGDAPVVAGESGVAGEDVGPSGLLHGAELDAAKALGCDVRIEKCYAPRRIADLFGPWWQIAQEGRRLPGDAAKLAKAVAATIGFALSGFAQLGLLMWSAHRHGLLERLAPVRVRSWLQALPWRRRRAVRDFSVMLAALLDEIESRYRVDKNRVYVTGLSMGGFGSWILTARHPDRSPPG